MSEEKFWMVWNANTHITNHRHTTEDLAKREASRLAAQNPGTRFYVLEAKGAMINQMLAWIECDEIPF